MAFTMRVATTIAAILGFAIPAAGQLASPSPLQAPHTHAATGLTFPQRIDDHSRLVRSVDRGKSEGQPELGYLWTYIVGPPINGTVSVYVYNAGEAFIPAGATSPQVFAQFHLALAEIGQQFPTVDEVKTVQGPADCSLGGIVFRCATLLAVTPKTNVPVYTKLLTTGYRNHFFSIWLEWDGSRATPAAAEVYLTTLIGALTR